MFAAGDVTVSFLIRYDSEPNYDYTFLQYRDSWGDWTTAALFDGKGDSLVAVVIPKENLPGTATIRFLFESDGVWSDEDGLWATEGAVIIDSLTVTDTTGVIDFQDFETEAVGALGTTDGDWTANPGFGDHAALFDGATVLQEDSVLTNTTNLWGFFAGSLDDYGCGGHPAQPAVPRTSVSGSDNLADYIQNEIWSPHIRLDEDVNQLPVPLSSSVTLEFDVYRDLPLDNLVFLQWRVRSIRDGCAGEWRNHDFVYYGAQKQWQRLTFELFPLIEPGASHIQVALGAVDLCFRLCGILGTGNCHSHAPLFDNVTVKARIPFDYTVINTLDAGAGSLREAITAAVALPDRNLIRFDIPGPGPHTIYPDSALPDISEPVIIDGTTQAGYAGGPVVALSGVNAGDVHGLKLEANRSVIKGLAIHNFARNGIFVTGDDDTLRGNYIGLTCAQAPGPNGRSGILLGVFNPWIYVDGTIIGGDQAHLANTIAYNAGDGVEISRWAGQGNAIRGNSIHSNDNLGIDIYGNGVTANDALDADGGPNSFQNYPVLDSAFAVANTIEGTLNSIPNRDFAIDFYANAACDTLGYGEGERYVGSTMVVTGGDGNISFTVAVPGTLSVGEAVTATATDTKGNTSEFSQCVTVVPDPLTGVGDEARIPDRLALFQNTPNPFNPTTTIRYDVPAGGATVRLVVYDVLGRQVRTLVSGFETAGQKQVTWHSLNDEGREVATGVYLVRMHVGSFTDTRKMVLLK
jgi:hypothetical protein